MCFDAGPLGRPRPGTIRTLVALGRGTSVAGGTPGTGTVLAVRRLLPSAGVGVWSGAAIGAVEPPVLESPAAPRIFASRPAVFPAGPSRPGGWARRSIVPLAVLLATRALGTAAVRTCAPVITETTTLTGTSVGPAVLDSTAIATRAPLVPRAAVRTETATTSSSSIVTESTAITWAPIITFPVAPVVDGTPAVVSALGPVVAIEAAGFAAAGTDRAGGPPVVPLGPVAAAAPTVAVIPVRPIGGPRCARAPVAWPAIGERSPVITRRAIGPSVLIPRGTTPSGSAVPAVVGTRLVGAPVPSAASTVLAGGAPAPVVPVVPTRARVTAGLVPTTR